MIEAILHRMWGSPRRLSQETIALYFKGIQGCDHFVHH